VPGTTCLSSNTIIPRPSGVRSASATQAPALSRRSTCTRVAAVPLENQVSVTRSAEASALTSEISAATEWSHVGPMPMPLLMSPRHEAMLP